jgi:hypothetical protein
VTNNPSLTCIEVDNIAYSTANWTDIDPAAAFSTNCNLAVPALSTLDANLNGYSIGNAAIDTDEDATTEASGAFTNINSVNKEINLSAYPNPTTKDITLDFGKLYQEVKIQVRNLTGQLVLNRELEAVSNTNLELQGATGIYFVNIQTEEGMATIKVIKE